MRHTLALHFAPLALRLGLGLTFIWAGAAKITQQMPVTPDNQSRLQAWGVISGGDAPADPAPDPTPDPITDPDPEPSIDIPQQTAPDPDSASEADGLIDDQAQPAEQDTPGADPQPDQQQASESTTASLVAFSAEREETVRRVYGLALLIDSSAHPMPDESGQPGTPLLPGSLAQGKVPVYLAWVAAITELIAGAAVLFGFFTRLGALPLAGTMGVAMWLTQIGPALQTGSTTLGFLPEGVFQFDAAGNYQYMPLLWQLSLLLMGFALFCTGPGSLSVDRLLFGPISTRRPAYGEIDDDNVEFVPMSGRSGRRAQRPSSDEDD